MITQHQFICQRHPKCPLMLLCIDQQCIQKGLICKVCEGDHQMHQILPVDQYVQQVREKQCSDSDIYKIKQLYQSMFDQIDGLKLTITAQIDSFRVLLVEEQKKELDQAYLIKDHQKEQMKLLQKCEAPSTSSNLSSALVELNDFNQESRIFENYDIVKAIIKKNTSAEQNIQVECQKFSRDFSVYLRKLTDYLRSVGSKSNSLNSQISQKSQRSSQIITANQQNQQDVFKWGQESVIREQDQKVEVTFDVPVSMMHRSVKASPDQNLKQSLSGQYQPNRQNQGLIFGKMEDNKDLIDLQTLEVPTSPQEIHKIEKYYFSKVNNTQKTDFRRRVDSDASLLIKDNNLFFSEIQKPSRVQVSLEKEKYEPNQIAKMFLGEDVTIKPPQPAATTRTAIKPVQSRNNNFENRQQQQEHQRSQSDLSSQNQNIQQSQNGKLRIEQLKLDLVNSKLKTEDDQGAPSLNQNKQAPQIQRMQAKIGDSDYRLYDLSPLKVTPLRLAQGQQQNRMTESDNLSQLSMNKQVIEYSNVQRVEEIRLDKFKQKPHKSAVLNAVIFEDEIFTCSSDGEIACYGLTTMRAIQNSTVSKSGLGSMLVFRDKSHKFILAGCKNGQTLMFQMINGKWKKIQEFTNLSKSSINCLVFLQNLPSYIFTFSEAGEADIFNWISGEKVSSHQVHEGEGNQIALFPIQTVGTYTQMVTRKMQILFVLGGGQQLGYISVWNGDQNLNFTNQLQFKAHQRPITKVEILPDVLITVARFDDQIKIWDQLNFNIRHIIREEGTITSLALYGFQFTVLIYDRRTELTTVVVWDLNDLKQRKIVGIQAGKYNQVFQGSNITLLGGSDGYVLTI